jgi:GrpB-like predicted nucleotidyltransferase (UPF0157 family)
VIEVVDYDPQWPIAFEAIVARIRPAVSNVALAIEHVGSTSVPGLAAKPIIDVDVVVDAADVPVAIERLAAIGYSHRGDLGVPGREAFRQEHGVPHNLYVCVEGSPHLRNHLVLRDRLRADPEAAFRYGALKRELAARFPNDIDAYVAGKSALILQVLETAGLPAEDLASIRGLNEPPKQALAYGSLRIYSGCATMREPR